ncbi:hypothetical protein HanXRQr2_Chr17g0801891 [Helianthus annuus]|uniref:Uncharacterized protein n=1 Tax=Helianthus annuus TaxID=4232 RepID=A0A9K3DJQ1_HELAN|nr:hypothetical protein HanXRQr2_Chr17g0801891 [Helianthus annuus]KAJ0429068.1 hypothetical protein HanHA300_Chr17g0653171 [Helianthus annuus]KAJ0447445.1 hypothetical protein HanHA89_Chr17g0705481 [Helianthus annuus]KAJ0632324.1 hypothetical protein HanLR1_Chr17g0663881 [Helianthus annuus]KAJ0813088.1 hypothetical protein HanPSC8_Chr17g0769481 [Helianthus annuus]
MNMQSLPLCFSSSRMAVCCRLIDRVLYVMCRTPNVISHCQGVRVLGLGRLQILYFLLSAIA